MLEEESVPMENKYQDDLKNSNLNQQNQKIPSLELKEAEENKEEQKEEGPRTLEKITSNYGFGKIVIITLLVISVGIAADGMEMTLMGLFLIPIKKFYYLTDQATQIISSILFLGIAISSYLAGLISNKLTRITSIKIAYLLLIVSHIVLSFANSIILFIIARFSIGLSLGIIVPLSLNLLSEFLPVNVNAFFLTSIWLFFSIGQVFSCLVMMVGMPNLEPSRLQIVLFCLTFLVLLAVLLNYFFIIESPKMLLYIGQHDKAFELLNKMLKEKKQPELTEEEKFCILHEKEESTIREQKLKVEQEQVSLEDIFKEKFLKLTILQMVIMFSLSFMLYGVILISSLTMNVVNYNDVNVPNETIYNKIIYDQFEVGLISIPGCVIGGLCSEWKYLGRRKTMALGFILASLFSMIIIFSQSHFPLMLSLYVTFVNLAFNVGLTYVVEIYPSKLKDISSGFLFGCLRISGFLSQFAYIGFHRWHYLIPYFISCGLGILAAILSIILPYEKTNSGEIETGIFEDFEENKEHEKVAEPLNGEDNIMNF